jgi:ATP-binding cassette subfamily B protein
MKRAKENSIKTQDVRLTRRLVRYLRPYRGRALAAVACTVLRAPLVLVGPLLTKVAIDLYFSPGAAQPPAGLAQTVSRAAEALGAGTTPYGGLLLIGCLFMLTNCGMFLLDYGQAAVSQLLGQRVVFDIREQLFAHLQRLPIRFFDRNPAGGVITRMTTDVSELNEMFSSGAVAVMGNVGILLFIVGWMFWADWRLALASFVALPLLVALTAWFRRVARTAARETRVQVAALNSFLQEHLTGMSVVHLFNREVREMVKFGQVNDAHRRVSVRAANYSALFSPAVEVIGALGVALTIWYGGGRVVSDLTTLGTLVAFIQLARAFYEPVSEISEKYGTIQGALAAAERIFKLLDEPADVTPAQPSKFEPARTPARIEFRNVWFAYDAEEWVLKDVSFVIEPGARVAVVGHTGAGKSTLTSLLLKLYTPQRGQILVDGVDIGGVAPRELRARFGVVPQDVFLFAGDVAANIRFGDETVTDERLQRAAAEVHADEFIRKLPGGYAAEVRERGAGLSAGQKQLISFARALASDPPALILDEATSSVDTQTERLICDAVERLMRGRTSLVIAHRLSTVRSADNIIVLHKGEVRESGAHDELLGRGGLYSRLYRLQEQGVGAGLAELAAAVPA